jgi:two-component system sensor histidine kinase KdpD
MDQKVDLVVGFAETHNRMDTAALLLGLELLPRRKIEMHGSTLEEFDLDAVLARRPQLVLVDEVAHANLPGSRHAKRWQDVLEVLDAGIDVFTTLNVQHLESLNDVVAQITQVVVRETVPDSLLERADEIELVDVAPEELLTRLREGKVYLPDEAPRATGHFFRRGNLLALRELALRRIAERVDTDVRRYRERHGVNTTWATSESILVCVGPAPSSAKLIRAAQRMAAGLRAGWVAAYVETAGTGSLNDADRDRLECHLRLAESLGASVTRLEGLSVSEALLHYARKHNVTRMILGKPTHSRLRDRLRGSLLNELVRGSGDIDVHVISGLEADERATSMPDGTRKAKLGNGLLWAVGIMAATTALGALLRAAFAIPDVEMVYLLAVMITALWFGRGPSILAAALAVAAYDFFFVPPFYTFAVASTRYLLTFIMMFLVGLLLSELTARVKRQEIQARQREQHTNTLYALSRDLTAAGNRDEAARVVVFHAAQVFESAAHLMLPSTDGHLVEAARFPTDACLPNNGRTVAQWVFAHARSAGLGTETLAGSDAVCMPLGVAAAPVGTLSLQPRSGIPLRAEQREFLEAFNRQAAFALERIELADKARTAALRAKAEEMRSSLLSTVSHDLRTPLATITGSASALRNDDPALDEATRRELLDSICEEAERLEKLVSNLLSMTRLESGAIGIKPEWVPLEEVIGAALTRLEDKLGTRSVEIDIGPDIPLLSIDPVLLAQVFGNLLENATKYTASDAAITICARREDGHLTLHVCDQGPGLPDGSEEKIFEKFYRGNHSGVPGVGLGLSICRGIVEAHGGSMRAENASGGGARFLITLPISDSAPPVRLVANEDPS